VVIGVARPRGVEKADSAFGHGGKDGKIDLKVKRNEGKTADNAEDADIGVLLKISRSLVS
jgi:hypothetical protein